MNLSMAKRRIRIWNRYGARETIVSSSRVEKDGSGLYEMTEGSGLKVVELFHLCSAEGRYGWQVPKGVWHTVEVIEPSVIYEAKDGKRTGGTGTCFTE